MMMNMAWSVVMKRTTYLSARRMSRDEAQYWIERSKQQSVFPDDGSFSKLNHLAEFGPPLSANVYKKIVNFGQRQTTSPVSPSSTNLGRDYGYGHDVPEYINENGINILEDDVRIPVSDSDIAFLADNDVKCYEEFPVKYSTVIENNVKHEDDDKIDTPVEYPTVRGVVTNNIKDVDNHAGKSIVVSDDNIIVEAGTDTYDTVHDDEEIRSIPRIRVPLLNTEREVLSPKELSGHEILKHGYKRDLSIPSVSKILAATMSEKSREVLARWEKEKIALLGLEGFKKLKSDTFARGHTLHTMLENFMETRQLPKAKDIPDSVSKRHLVSISQAVKQFHTPLLLESAVAHPDLNYGGIVDCVAVLGDTVMLVDWKTSEKVKNRVSDLYDNPLQLAAYMGALNRDERYSHLGNIINGAVVVVYNSGYPAMVHMFNQKEMEGYWDMWCDRLEMFKNM